MPTGPRTESCIRRQDVAEMATILAIIGIVVAGTDGWYLSRAGASSLDDFMHSPGHLLLLSLVELSISVIDLMLSPSSVKELFQVQ